MFHYKSARLSPGYTLIEVITVVAVLVITTGIATPVFSDMLNRSYQTASINEFSTALAQARYYAITHMQRVVLCPSVDQQICTGGFNWEQGYLSFVDENRDRQRNPGEKILNTHTQTDNNIRIQTSTGRRKITFHTSGMSPGSNATIRFCASSDDIPGKTIILSNTGRPRLAKKLRDGSPVTCI